MLHRSRRNLVPSMLAILSAIVFAGTAQAQWTAYNDCVYDAALNGTGTDPNGQSVHYIGSNVTVFGIGQASADSPTYGGGQYPNTSGTLLNQADGVSTGVTATFTQNGAVNTVNWQPQVAATWTGGYDTASGTDAYNVFNGIADMTGAIYYGGSGWWVDLTLTGLDPANTYTFVTSASRAKANTDGAPGYNTRNTQYTLSGATSSTNNSSAGVTEVGGDPLVLVMNTGNNHADGRVIRWDDIDPGGDGTVTIRAESEGVINQAYTFDVFMLEEVVAGGVCGDGNLDAGEDCDNGAANGTAGQCCSSSCSFETGVTECRASADVCDVAEQCSGASASCPVDGFAAGGTECRASADVCDEAEQCTGSGVACPTDGFLPPSTECRASADICDVAEQCTGSGPGCPTDGFATAGTPCRGSAGICDVAEQCTGGGASCPADGFVPGGTECRAAAGQCDVAEDCTGSAAACPVDGFASSATPCDDGVGCTESETCDGVGACESGTPNDALCADPLFCNGDETCDTLADCQPGTPPPGDGVVCTDDVCDEVNDVVVSTPNDANCDNGLWCDGVETCDAVLDCQAGTAPPLVPDGVSCTDATCDEPNDRIAQVPNDAHCQNGDVCDGAEFCNPIFDCQPPLAPLDCDDGDECTADACDAVLGCSNTPIPSCVPVPSASPGGRALLSLLVVGAGAVLLSRRGKAARRA